jgi:hypothetical protein
MRETNRSILGILTLVACLVPLSAARADFDRNMTLSADTLVLHNLIGEIEVSGHNGPDFEVVIHVQGRDASPERVSIETDEGNETGLAIRFPLDESKRYVYPRLKNGNVSFSADDGGSWLSKLLGNGNIKVSGNGKGLEIWADVTIKTPRGATLVIDHGVGSINAREVEANLDLSTRSGPVEVAGAAGAVSVDTGSGRVTVENIDGELNVDTGSGRVTISGVTAKNVHVDTGSGRVKLDDIDSSTLYVDTGSGRVEARAVSADDVTIDTGSGSVTLQLDRMGHGRFKIDTGSGGIDLQLPPDASAEVSVDTGSGGIRLDLTGDYRMQHKEDDQAKFTIGSGTAKLILDAGSGSIHISQ